jgi:hypothetical protein
MTRLLRFLVYAVFLVVGVALNAPAIQLVLRSVASGCYWAPVLPSIVGVAGVLLGSTAYSLWLSMATLMRAPMPLWTHVIPIVLMLGSLIHGPLALPHDRFYDQAPADRALAAGQALADHLHDGKVPCADAGEHERFLERSQELAPPGYRAHGFSRAFKVVVQEGGQPVRAPGSAEPGSLLLVCEPGAKRFWISAVVSDAIPVGAPIMVRDGVGRPAVLTGEVAR